MCPSYLATRDEKDSTRGRARVLAGDGQRDPGLRRLEVPRGAGLPGPVPVLQGVLVGLPGRDRHGPVQVRGDLPGLPAAAAAPARTTRWAGCPAGPGWPAPRPGWPTRCCGSGRWPRRSSPRAGWTPGGRSRPSPRCRSAARPPAAPPPGPAGRTPSARGAVGRLVQRRLRPRGAAGRAHRAGPGRRPGDRPGTFRLLRPDLDQHRPAGRRPDACGTLLDVLGPYAEAGIPIVGLEPSCTAVLRSDLGDLFPGDPRATAVAAAARTLAELLTAPPPLGPGPDWNPPDLTGTRRGPTTLPPVRGHGLRPDRGAPRRGRDRGHHALRVLWPGRQLRHGDRALRRLRGRRGNRSAARAPGRAPGTVFLADGFSCRTQAGHSRAPGIHLAQFLAAPPRP